MSKEKKYKIIDRLFEYLSYIRIPPTRFEKEIGLSNGYLGTQLKRNSDIGEGIINKIIDNCLILNPIWLISGKGEMLKNTVYNEESEIKSYVSKPSKSYSTNCQNCLLKDELIENLKNTIQAQKIALNIQNENIKLLKKNKKELHINTI